jgi:hypothetical protein
MAIINMTSNKVWNSETKSYEPATSFPDGAYCPLGEYNKERSFEKAIVLYKSHVGLCLFESERNGYHDSDFYMTVWNPVEKKPETICFASTRGWCYPCYGSAPDASDEVRAEYAEWKKAADRRRRIENKWRERKELNKLRDEMGLNSRADVWKLIRAVGPDAAKGPYHRLLKTKNFRSDFRKSLASQVRDWIAGNREYKRPLSYKQEAYL